MESEEINTAYISCIVLLNLIAWMLLVTAVGLGAIHYNECPIQPHIPIYLIVIGACGLILLMLAYWMNTLREGFWKQICILCVLCLSVFSIIWLITGSVWIYAINPPNFNSSAVEDFCQKSLYMYGFWFNILCFVCVFISIPCCICYVLYECVSIYGR